MEEKYWELKENVDRTFDAWFASRTDDKYLAYRGAQEEFTYFCVAVLERLMETNADVLKNLKDWG